MNLDNVDAVLHIIPDNIINEDDQERLYGHGTPDYTWHGSQYDVPDLKLYGAFTFGKVMRASLENMGQGYYNKITDFGKYVLVTIGYHNQITGRANEKTFLIDFTPNGNGIVLSTSKRYRTINGVQQAISYMKSAAQSLRNNTDRT